MPGMTIRLILASLFFATVANAQMDMNLSTQKLSDRLTVLYGAGGNVAIGGGETTYVVDDKLQPVTDKVKAEVAKVSKGPIRFVINTHWHGDHTGGNAALGKDGAVIVAHDNVRKRLSTDQFNALFKKSTPASPAIALPVVTFADTVTLHLNGDDLEVQHVPPAHTDGDAIIWWVKDDVVHMGDCFFTSGYPFVDLSSGGNLDGYITAAEKVLARAKDTTKIIPGHGKVADKKQLKTWHDMLTTVRDRVKKAIKEGKTLEQVQAMKPTAEFDQAYQSAFIKPEMFVQAAYESYSPRK